MLYTRSPIKLGKALAQLSDASKRCILSEPIQSCRRTGLDRHLRGSVTPQPTVRAFRLDGRLGRRQRSAPDRGARYPRLARQFAEVELEAASRVLRCNQCKAAPSPEKPRPVGACLSALSEPYREFKRQHSGQASGTSAWRSDSCAWLAASASSYSGCTRANGKSS